MHILIIPSEEFITEQNPGAGIFQYHQASALQKSGVKVSVLSIRQSLSIAMLVKAMLFRLFGHDVNNELKGKTFSDLFSLLYNKTFQVDKFISKEQMDGLTVHRVGGFYFFPPSKYSNHIGWLHAGMALWKRFHSEEGLPDIIHAHNAVYAGILANRISDRYKVPYVITEHSSYVARDLESPSIKGKIRQSYKQAASFFVVSDFLGKKIDEVYRDKFNWKVMPNVLDPKIENEPLPATVPSTGFLFIAIGLLIPLKRHKDLILAFHEQFAGKKDTRLTIAGFGELENDLQHLINDLKLNDQVKLTGWLERDQVIQLIDQSNCLVQCSEIETFGVAMIESLSRGKPVISSRCGGPESIVNTKNGLLYTIADITGLGTAMQQMKTNYEKYDQQAIRNDAITNYGTRSFAERMKKEYSEIIS